MLRLRLIPRIITCLKRQGRFGEGNVPDKIVAMNLLNRREMLRAAAVIGAGLTLSSFSELQAQDGPRKKVLFFTKSSGFQHSVITRKADEPDKLAYAEQILTDLAAKHGVDVVCSKDGRIFASPEFATVD